MGVRESEAQQESEGNKIQYHGFKIETNTITWRALRTHKAVAAKHNTAIIKYAFCAAYAQCLSLPVSHII